MMKIERSMRVWIWIPLSCLTISITGCLHRIDPAPARPVPPAEQIAQQTVSVYAELLAKSFEETCQQLQAGTLQTAEEVNQHLQSSNSSARKQAFQPLDELLNEKLGGENWDLDQAKILFPQISTGFRRTK